MCVCLCEFIYLAESIYFKFILLLLTDHGNEILNNCANNVKLNSELFNGQDTVHVRELDWTKPWPPRISLEESALSNSLFLL